MSSSTSQLFTEREHLTTAAYADSTNLQARVSIYHHRDPQVDFVTWAINHLDWPEAARVLDVGCGYGQYLKQLSQPTVDDLFLIGVDLSSGMLKDLSQQWDTQIPLPHLGVADAQHLPFSANSYDIVLAMHLLYHVPNIEQAAHELRRILRSGGTLLVATNGENHLHEIEQVFCMVLCNMTENRDIARFLPRISQRFSLENGASLLRTTFDHIERQDLTGVLKIPEIAPVLAYADSMRPTIEKTLPDGVTWEEIMRESAQLINDQIAQHGVFEVQTHAGVFLCN